MTETGIDSNPKVAPVEVRRAVAILWASLLVAFIASVINWERHIYRGTIGFTVSIQVSTFGLFALLNWKISEGRRWAQITWLLIFMAGGIMIVLFSLFSRTYRAAVFDSMFSAAVIMVQTAIQFYATVLLFTPKGRAWFLTNQ